MFTCLHVKSQHFLSDFKELEFSRRIFEKYSNMKFHENPSSGSRVVPRRSTDIQKDRQTDRHNANNSRFSQLFDHA